MKRYSIYILNLLAGFIFFSSCTDEMEMKYSTDVKEGQAVSLSLSFATGEAERIETKSALTEGHVYDLYVLLFDDEGSRIKLDQSYFENLNGTNGSVTLNTTTGKRRIYGIANIESDATEGIEKALDAVESEDELKSLRITLTSKVVSFSGRSFLSSGFFTSEKDTSIEPEEAETVIVDLASGSGEASIKNLEGKDIKGSIKLIRAFSTIKFNISTAPGKVTSFTPTSWQVVDVPQISSLYMGGESGSPFSAKESERFAGSSFEFAMMENLKTGSKIANANDREGKRPSGATYVVLKGHYVGKGDRYDDGGHLIALGADINANVSYFISLGQGADRSTKDLGDYKSKRNKEYTYNVTVAGVDKIITEVIEKSPYHRADGDITYVGGEAVEFDAHYGDVVYTFTSEDIKNFTVDFQVKTPFTGGSYIKLTDKNDADKNDAENWEWVHFVVNDVQDGSYLDTKKRYPGKGDPSLMDVRAFKEYLKTPGNFKNEKLKVTCFIDEYYYESKKWTEFVNGDPRVMQILCTSKEYTHDGDHTSSLIEARYVISQKPIETIYSTDDSNADWNAWGIEWVNESGLISRADYGGFARDYNDGLANLYENIAFNNLKNWYKDETSSEFNSEFQKAYAACMSRNRDENGNGIIDDAEKKWYLPAINQYLDIWMGSFGLPNGLALYQGQGGDPKEGDLYVASNLHEKGGQAVFWSIEGSSFGSNNGPAKQKLAIRCAQNLRRTSSTSGSSTCPDPYYAVEEDDKIINLNKINTKSIREQYLTTELAAHTHTDLDGANAPYHKFQVASSAVESSIAPKKLKEDILGNNSPCKDYQQDGDGAGWRLPNQRELQMIVRSGVINMDLGLITYTTYEYSKSRMYYYNTDYKNLALTSDENQRRVRCVRDVK